jgi:hypothetical protein
MRNAGEKPGPGSYQCADCGEVIILTDNSDELLPCPYCRANSYHAMDRRINTQYELFPAGLDEDAARRFDNGFF